MICLSCANLSATKLSLLNFSALFYAIVASLCDTSFRPPSVLHPSPKTFAEALHKIGSLCFAFLGLLDLFNLTFRKAARGLKTLLLPLVTLYCSSLN
jgi:hypothetical protein